MNYTISPAIIAHSQQELATRLKKIASVKPSLIHLDIMDGQFVEHTSMEFDFKLPKHAYEAHLMIREPAAWIKHNLPKVKSVIVHYAADAHIHDIIAHVQKAKKYIGLAINPEVPVDSIAQYLKLVDNVLVMTVHPGKYGAPFLPEMLEKIRYLRAEAPRLDIEVDGGITPHTLVLCKQAGANQFAVGSFLQKAKDVRKAYTELTGALKH